MTVQPVRTDAGSSANDKFLFWACFISLIATAVAFVTRLSLLKQWEVQFNLSGEQAGQIMGAGIWPFAISIILFSLVVDKIGYKVAMMFAFFAHIAYGVMVICAPLALAGADATPDQINDGRKTAYWLLYVGSFILGLSNGTVEAVINPVVATMFNRQKVKWLNILHSGWAAGLVIGGLLAILITALGVKDWRWTIAIIFIPAIIYGPMMMIAKFPLNERVAAGFSYMGMLKEFGVLASILVVPLVVRQVGLVAGFGTLAQAIVSAVIIGGFAAIVQAPGRVMLFVLMLIMMPLAITELGTDGWITTLMEQPLKKIGMHAAWVLVYTSFIMMMLRAFAAGPIAHKLNPLGLLAVSSVLAICGLFFLSQADGWMIFAAATLYALGKTFFWPTMLGVVAEQSPKGGALTLNAVGGMGMVAVGVLGGPLIGLLQDREIVNTLSEKQPTGYAQVIVEKDGMFGKYKAVDGDKVKALPEAQGTEITKISDSARQSALATVTIFPAIMLVSYLLLIGYFASRGGYKAVRIDEVEAEKAPVSAA